MEAFNLGRRLACLLRDDVVTTIITYEEQMRGWLSYLSQAKTLERQVEAYTRLRGLIDRYREIPVVDFDWSAAAEFKRLRDIRTGLKSPDLKIAAIALAND